MTILLLTDEYPPRGQSSVSGVVSALAHGFQQAGHDVHILTTHRTSMSLGILREGNITSLPRSYRPALRSYLSLYSPTMNALIAQECRRIRPDVIHAHNLHAYLTYDALRIARQFTDRVSITLHDAMSFSYGRLATDRYLASGGTDVRVTWMDHLRQVGAQWNPLRGVFIRHALTHHATAVVAVSQALRRAVVANGMPCTHVIHHGIDAAGWQCDDAALAHFRSRYHLEGRKVVLFGGRLRIDKGVIPLLRAFALLRQRVPAASLLVAGEAGHWDEMIRCAGVSSTVTDAIVTTGWLSRDEMRTAYYAADLVTTPSLCLDTFNLMNLEAMAAGKPVVGTCFGGTPEVVQDGETGFIVDPRDPALFSEKLRILLLDPALQERMGEAGRVRAMTSFTMDAQVRAYLSLFDSRS